MEIPIYQKLTIVLQLMHLEISSTFHDHISWSVYKLAVIRLYCDLPVPVSKTYQHLNTYIDIFPQSAVRFLTYNQ